MLSGSVTRVGQSCSPDFLARPGLVLLDLGAVTVAQPSVRGRANGDDPSEYVDISYRISETKFNAWPESLKSAFAPARTLKTGKPGFRLALLQE